MTRFATLLIALVCASCTFSFPVVGRLSSGAAMQGTVTASTDGVGQFTASTTDGLSCSGTYDALDDANTITFPVTCSDGRKGVVIATRDNTKVKGTAIAELEDGTRGEFIFGQVSAETQAAFLARSVQ